MLTVQCKVHFQIDRRSRKRLTEGTAPTNNAAPVEAGRVPTISRIMALAIRLQRLLGEGVTRDYADLARLGDVTRARITQVMNLLNLAPDIQETLLFLPRTIEGRHPINEHDLRRLAAVADWRKQRKLFSGLKLSEN